MMMMMMMMMMMDEEEVEEQYFIIIIFIDLFIYHLDLWQLSPPSGWRWHPTDGVSL